MSSRQAKERLPPEAYLARECMALYKSEYVQGDMFAMTGASRRPNVISLQRCFRITTDLTVTQVGLATCTTDLVQAQADLAACQAEPNAVFSGDGAGHGPALSYTDCGDGTATVNNTLRMWEVKDDSGGVHDKDNTYTWTADGFDGTAANGMLFTVFLNALNNMWDGANVTDCTANGDAACGAWVCGLAGHRDWCIPQCQGVIEYCGLWAGVGESRI